VQVGDVILNLAGEPIAENFDLIYAVGQHKQGDKAILEVARQGETLKLPIEFQPLPPMGPHK
jgi:serine protease Do